MMKGRDETRKHITKRWLMPSCSVFRGLFIIILTLNILFLSSYRETIQTFIQQHVPLGSSSLGQQIEYEKFANTRTATINVIGQQQLSAQILPTHEDPSGVNNRESITMAAISTVGPTAPVTPIFPLSDAALRHHLNFSSTSTINFMHFHKTGGNSIKFGLHFAYTDKKKSLNQPVRNWGSCYRRPSRGTGKNKNLTPYRCDWIPLFDKTVAERNSIDLIFGHQFLQNGVSTLLPGRRLHEFTVLRHPFDRKVSSFFHFMVRQMGRNQDEVQRSEISKYLLREEGDKGKAIKCDAGPNYYAGRFLSSGFNDYKSEDGGKHIWYDVPDEEKVNVVSKVKNILDGFVFIGLQSEPMATRCIMGKMLSNFDSALGIEGGSKDFMDRSRQNKFNKGGYNQQALKIWEEMDDEERKLFKNREWVDLRIYEHGKKLFHRQVEMFGCSEFLKAS